MMDCASCMIYCSSD